MMKTTQTHEYAVLFTYNFDEESEVTLFDDYDTAKQYLKESYEEELRIERDENEWEDELEYFIDDDGTYAEIKHYGNFGEDICEYRLCTNVRRADK